MYSRGIGRSPSPLTEFACCQLIHISVIIAHELHACVQQTCKREIRTAICYQLLGIYYTSFVFIILGGKSDFRCCSEVVVEVLI